ncbi:hypothetical protein BTJ39_23365 [Izhakiella australiensis]|uniref:Conjugal transfer protein TraS n=1 Tax=Izhakiella australiensis TaxID=1926881 RepID=A0A1S8Y787_9GAMM|nr:hypothetical protein [Izhakiella australiensis]OON34707.1 hypothetical protein BTJ39_23365 [Izhakiella australiensis]
MMTYEQIEKDSKAIASLMSESKREVPSFFSMFGKVKIHFIAYCTFALLSYFSLPTQDGFLLWLFFLFFGLFHWLVIFAFVASYAGIFAMLDKDILNRFELSRVIGKKVKVYGMVWFFLILVSGVVSLVSEWSLIPLVIGNFITTLIALFVFNVDISRYQIAGFFGAVAAAKEKMVN